MKPYLKSFEKSVAKSGIAMVNFNNADIATLQIFKIFIVFIVSRSSDVVRFGEKTGGNPVVDGSSGGIHRTRRDNAL